MCFACGFYKPKLTIHKTRNQAVRDVNAFGKRVALIIQRRYFTCHECGAHFAEQLDSVGAGARITKRLRTHIAQKARHSRFTIIEDEYRVSDTTIREAFLEDVRSLPPAYAMDTPSVLGIDEIHLKSNG